ncbi:Sporulation related domain-containing protein [Kushneria avicenniae]|uniref:Sporulation related domain-containing protein n=1 Tax=Kushneria avicenniae TaxID=402385 RepID=A0A1I1HZQ5_9GAMM|nr:SPOR domain-containing protein [Kushneria avicenniae]SFC29331.1 Sporulation related domain-containing protein [Kushneria avicenniae]
MAQRQSKKAAPSGKGATSRNKAKRSGSGDGFHIPGWLWALVGIIAGFAVAQYFQSDAPPKRDQVAAVVTKKRTDANAQKQEGENAQQPSEEGQMPTFEFYTLLPESEVIAPNVEDYSSPPRPGTEGAVLEQHARRIAGSNGSASVSNPEGQKASSSQQSASSSKPEPKSSADSKDAIQQMASRHETSSRQQSASAQQQSSSSAGARYMLQAASFKSQSDANNMAGKLRDLGLVMQVTQVQTADNTTWYRVQAGPYQDSGELARARGLMQTRGIDPMQIQQR